MRRIVLPHRRGLAEAVDEGRGPRSRPRTQRGRALKEAPQYGEEEVAQERASPGPISSTPPARPEARPSGACAARLPGRTGTARRPRRRIQYPRLCVRISPPKNSRKNGARKQPLAPPPGKGQKNKRDEGAGHEQVVVRDDAPPPPRPAPPRRAARPGSTPRCARPRTSRSGARPLGWPPRRGGVARRPLSRGSRRRASSAPPTRSRAARMLPSKRSVSGSESVARTRKRKSAFASPTEKTSSQSRYTKRCMRNHHARKAEVGQAVEHLGHLEARFVVRRQDEKGKHDAQVQERVPEQPPRGHAPHQQDG